METGLVFQEGKITTLQSKFEARREVTVFSIDINAA